jgi:hypothetical protein
LVKCPGKEITMFLAKVERDLGTKKVVGYIAYQPVMLGWYLTDTADQAFRFGVAERGLADTVWNGLRSNFFPEWSRTVTYHELEEDQAMKTKL